MKINRLILPIILVVICVPIALFSMFVVVANVVTKDEAPPDISSIQLPDVTVADADNAFIELDQIEKAERFSDDIDKKLTDVVGGAIWDDAYVASLIEQHAKDIVLFRQSAKKPEYQYPGYSHLAGLSLNTMDFPSFTSTRKAAQVVALEAQQRGRRGDVEGGLDEAIAVIKIGHQMETGQGPLIQYLVGSAIKQYGLTSLRQIAVNSEISTAQVLPIVQALESYRDSRTGQVNAVKFEASIGLEVFPGTYKELMQLYNLSSTVDGRTVQPGFIDWIGSQMPPVESRNSLAGALAQIVWTPIAFSGATHYYYQPNQTKHLALVDGLKRIKNAEADCASVNLNPALTDNFTGDGLDGFFTPNAIGRLVLDIGQISYEGLSTKRCNESVSISATEAIVAVSAYTAVTGSVPASLSELVPKYFNEVPIDPYTGNPISYLADDKVIYSFGPGRKDLGGSPVSADWQNLENPAFAISQ